MYSPSCNDAPPPPRPEPRYVGELIARWLAKVAAGGHAACLALAAVSLALLAA